LDGEDTRIDYIEPNVFDNPADFGEGGTILDGGTPGIDNGPYFQNPSNYYLRYKMDHITQNEADSIALRGDVEYDIDEGWFDSVRVGARFSQRDSLLQETLFNWGNISEWWTGQSPTGDGDNLLRLNNPLFNGVAGFNDFENFQRGGGAGNFPGIFWTGPLASDYEGFLQAIQPFIDSTNAEGRGGETLLRRRGLVDGTPFIAPEINRVKTDNFAAYARLDFGNEDTPFANGMTIDGNVGVRYIRTDVNSASTFSVANIVNTPLNPATSATRCELQPGQTTRPGICALSDAEIAQLEQFFSNDQLQALDVDHSYERILPSLNLKLQLNDEMLLRFGAARSMARPDESQLRIGTQINFASDLPVEDPNNPGFDTFRGLQAFSGNPFLNPTMSNQIDLSYEWYFGEGNSFTVAGFYKELEDAIIPTVTVGGSATGGVFNEGTIVSNGVEQVVTFNQPDNSDIKANFKGFEVSYQQFYDFLPGALSNFGIQANYTYIDATSPGEFDNSVTGNTSNGNEPLQRDGSRFEQVSKHQYNIAGIYEDEKISARLAYNWRDDFLLVRRDVIFPFSSIFQKATGQLDGSIFYTVNDNFKVGLTGVNLLDDVTETEQLINGTVPSGLNIRAPRSFIRNDRRFTLSLRANF
jgi:TonB-dependent receptor